MCAQAKKEPFFLSFSFILHGMTPGSKPRQGVARRSAAGKSTMRTKMGQGEAMTVAILTAP